MENTPRLQETLKYDQGKPDFTLIPQHALLEVAKVFTHGAKKYQAYNFSLGTDHRRYIAAAHRHINQYLLGEDIDEIGTHHLANAAASCMMVLDNILSKVGTDDRNINYLKQFKDEKVNNSSEENVNLCYRSKRDS